MYKIRIAYTLIIIILTLLALKAIASREAQCVYFDTASFDSHEDNIFILEMCDGTYREFRKKVKGELSL